LNEDDLRGRLEQEKFGRLEGGREISCISMEGVARIASALGLTSRQVAVAALEDSIIPLRYVKNIGTTGVAGQATLLKSTVAVVGAGGIGSRAAELLARMGVGKIVLADPDVFDETNLNRQGFSCETSVGLPKVEVAAERLAEINCDVEVSMERLAAEASNVDSLLQGADVVIDALDNIEDRLLVMEACRRLGTVMVHGAIAGTCVQVTTLYPGDSGLESFLPVATGDEKSRGIEVETGNPATTPTLAAAIQVQETVKVILGRGETLRGRLLYLETDDWTFEFIDL